jgi:RHS repeat-associated protein
MRVQKSSGTLYWRAITGEVLAETDATGKTMNEYIYFAGLRVAWWDSRENSYYINSDGLGTTRTITESNGTVCYDADFTPYGQEIQHTNTCPSTYNYKFTGYERDSETQLDYAVARFYNWHLGRFLSADPLGGSSGDPQSLNRYTYVENGAPNSSDPSGMLKYPCPGRGDMCDWGLYDAWFSEGLSFNPFTDYWDGNSISGIVGGGLVGGGGFVGSCDLGAAASPACGSYGGINTANGLNQLPTLDALSSGQFEFVNEIGEMGGDIVWASSTNPLAPAYLKVQSDCLLGNGVRQITYSIQNKNGGDAKGFWVSENQSDKSLTPGNSGTTSQGPNEFGLSGFTDLIGGIGTHDSLQTFSASPSQPGPGVPSIPLFVRDANGNDYGTLGIYIKAGVALVNGKASQVRCP